MRFSFIIPVYNSSEYINECIQSIFRQDYDDIEIIAVDDASSDDSLSILRNISDDRLKVFSNDTNKGVSYTRNRALKEATGDWVAFLDSDDYLSENALKEIISIIESDHKIDIVQYNLMMQENNEKHVFSTLMNGIVENKHEIIESIISIEYGRIRYGKYGNCRCAGGKFYRRSVIDNLFFPEELSTFEDGIFNIKAYLRANKIYLDSNPLYIYRRIDSSSTKSINPVLNVEMELILKNILDAVGWDVSFRESYAHNKFHLMIRSIFVNMMLLNFNDGLKKIKELISTNKKSFSYVSTEYLGKRDRIYLWLASHDMCLALYMAIYVTKRYFNR